MFIPAMEFSEKPNKLFDLTDVSGLIQTQSSNGNVSNRQREGPDMLTSRQNLKFFLDLFANFLNFARAHDGHSSFTFKSTINIKFVFLYLILSVHNV